MASVNFIEYLKTIAQTHKSFLHTETNQRFFEISSAGAMEDLMSNLQQADGYIIMADNSMEGNAAGKDESYTDRARNRFFVMKRRDYAEMNEDTSIKKACKSLAFSIMARMRYDRTRAWRGEIADKYKDIDPSSFKYDTVGPLADGWVGVMVDISFVHLASDEGMVFNADDYTSI